MLEYRYIPGQLPPVHHGIVSGSLYLIHLRRFFVVESGGEHFAPKLAVEVRQWGNTLIRSAVEVRRGTL